MDTYTPYRSSKITFLLKDSLGGNCKTTVIANVSQSACCSGETLSTLMFASRAKKIKNEVVVHEDMHGSYESLKLELIAMKAQLLEYKTGARMASAYTSMHNSPSIFEDEESKLRAELDISNNSIYKQA